MADPITEPGWYRAGPKGLERVCGLDEQPEDVPEPVRVELGPVAGRRGAAVVTASAGGPCRYCLAAYPILFEDGDTTSCEWEHRDEQRVYDLAAAMARVFQPRPNTDEQVAWFLQDADAIVDDFDPVPEKWRIRKLPLGSSGEFVMRFRVNDVTYVVQEGGKEKANPIRLSTLRAAQREAIVPPDGL